MPVIHRLHERDVMIPGREFQIAKIDYRFQLSGISISPVRIALRTIPWNRADDLYTIRQFVECDVPEIRIVRKDEIQVIYRILQQARFSVVHQM